MKRFFVVFSVLLVALFSLEMWNPVQAALVVPFTTFLAQACTLILAPFDPNVVAYGKVLQFRDSGFAVSIEAGCNGVEATIVLIAAVVAFPAAWKQRLVAIAAGFVAIQVLNLVRIISLFYLGDWNLAVFSWVHLYLWPALIMLDVLIVFILYLRYLSRQQPEAGHAAG